MTSARLMIRSRPFFSPCLRRNVHSKTHHVLRLLLIQSSRGQGDWVKFEGLLSMTIYAQGHSAHECSGTWTGVFSTRSDCFLPGLHVRPTYMLQDPFSGSIIVKHPSRRHHRTFDGSNTYYLPLSNFLVNLGVSFEVTNYLRP